LGVLIAFYAPARAREAKFNSSLREKEAGDARAEMTGGQRGNAERAERYFINLQLVNFASARQLSPASSTLRRSRGEGAGA